MPAATVNATLPGIFYNRATPGDPVFKAPGDSVGIGDTIGLIEVMKSFLPVVSPVEGKFARYLLDNEDAVDTDQPLCEIEL